jgi:hypothetical protein
MSVIDRSLDRLTFLTDSARDALRRRLREVAGVSLIVLALLLAAALATWSAQDPSLSHATNAPIRNRLGIGGAIVSDLLMQLLGLASLALALAMAMAIFLIATGGFAVNAASTCARYRSAFSPCKEIRCVNRVRPPGSSSNRHSNDNAAPSKLISIVAARKGVTARINHRSGSCPGNRVSPHVPAANEPNNSNCAGGSSQLAMFVQ